MNNVLPSSPLPFYTEVLSSLEQKTTEALMPILEARASCYGRHLPQFSQALLQPEPDDLYEDSVLFVLRSKLDHHILGGLRYQTNQKHSLPLEHVLTLPENQKGKKVCEATRFFITRPQNDLLKNSASLQPLVRLSLFKIFFEKALADGMDFMTIMARPPIDKNYEAIGFTDIHEKNKLYPLKKMDNIGHRFMTLPLSSCNDEFMIRQFPILGHFVFRQIHPDLPQYDIKPVLVAPDVISEDFLDFSKTTLKPLMLDLELPF